jgi:MFS transporter, DHA1 family, multidrug resistance protein
MLVSYLCAYVLTHLCNFQNPHNWSSAKKAWVMFQTCLLTFTIYVGSAIYTAGIPYITEEFHVSTVAATVGLTVFVAGYGLGK